MIQKIRRAAMYLTISTFTASGVAAQGVPVIDATAVAQYVTQINQMKQDYLNQIDQLTNLEDQLVSMTGAKGISDILNGASDQAARISADSLSGIMDGAMTGVTIPGNASAITARLDELKTTFDLGGLDTFLSSALPQERGIATQAGSGMAAVATAEDTYRRADAAMGRVNALIDGIDGNPDLKASIDYNSRMLAEVAVLLNESLRVQAAMANAIGTDSVADAQARAAERTFMKASKP